jgi:hypothetical protein
MSESEPEEQNFARSRLVLIKSAAAGRAEQLGPRPAQSARSAVVSFDQRELRVIFDLYGARVASGEWRDYALDFSPAKAVFSIFRRACETPIYRIEKAPALARRQGAYSVIDASGLIMRRGQDLARVVGVLEPRLRLVGAE